MKFCLRLQILLKSWHLKGAIKLSKIGGKMERWKDGEMERWRDGKMERLKVTLLSIFSSN